MSSKLERLNAFHTNLLADVGVFDKSGEGMLSWMNNGEPCPVTISKKRLVIPTKPILREADWEKRIAFAPLSEQINQGPSPVLNALKAYIHTRLTETIKTLGIELMSLAVDVKRQKNLPTAAATYLKDLPDADQKTLDTLQRVFQAVTDAPERRIVTIYLAPKGENGALRTCKVGFPILADADNDDPTEFFGVKMPRKTKDKALIVALLKYILGDEETREGFTQHSRSTDAPYFHSLLLTFSKFVEHLNALIERHSKVCDRLIGLEFQYGWKEEVENFETFAADHLHVLPPLAGNKGASTKDTGKERKPAYEWDEPEDDEPVREKESKSEKIDLPWEDDPAPADTQGELSRSRVRREQEDREERPNRRRDDDRRQSGVRTASLNDLLRGRRDDDRDDRDDRRGGRDDRRRDDRRGNRRGW